MVLDTLADFWGAFQMWQEHWEQYITPLGNNLEGTGGQIDSSLALQWVAQLDGPGFIPGRVLTVPVWVLTGCSGFLLQSKDILPKSAVIDSSNPCHLLRTPTHGNPVDYKTVYRKWKMNYF